MSAGQTVPVAKRLTEAGARIVYLTLKRVATTDGAEPRVGREIVDTIS